MDPIESLVPRATLRESRTDPARRVVAVAVVGHAIEWYEFTIYGVLAGYIALSIFPSDDPTVALMLTWATFATAFLVRPIGGFVLASLSDRFGRRTALFSAVLLMTTATVCLALVPSYAAIGAAAPLIFLALRMIQGFAIGGEMSSAVPYVTESVDSDRRVRSVSWLAAGTFSAGLLGALVAAGVAALLDAQQMMAWGWRLPFLLALPLGIVALIVRRRAPESQEFEKSAAQGRPGRTPLREALRVHRRPIFSLGLLAVAFNVGVSATLSGYLSEVLQYGILPAESLMLTVLANSALIGSILLAAPLAARWGRRPAIGVGATSAALLAIPQLYLSHSGHLGLAIIGSVLLAVPVGIMATPVYLSMSELFPLEVRSSASALGFNTATAISSLVPVTTLALRAFWGVDFGLAIWVIAAMSAALAVIAFGGRESRNVGG